MKKLILLALAVPAIVFAQSYPAPTFNSVVLQNPLTPANGGTGATTSTGTGSVVLSNSPSLASPVITGSLTATGLITLPSLAAQAANTVIANATGSSASPTAFTMPSCSGSNTALQWTTSSGFGCNTGIVPASGGNYTGVLGISASSAHMNINDTSGSGSAYLVFQNNNATAWRLLSNSSTGVFSLDRYVSGSFADSPLQFNGSSGLLTMPDALTVNGALAANNSFSVGATRTSAGGIEIGGTAGTSANAYSDFHSSGNNIDYDSRIIASGGNATVGQGSLQYIAAGGHTFSGGVTFNNGVTMGSTLAVGGTVSGAGFSNYLAAPPAIGGTTANTGAFTTLTASTANPSLLYNQGGTSAVNRTYQSKFQDSISVKDFGAIGNGTTDDTAAIQAAINAACSAGGGLIYLPKGTYKTIATLAANCSNLRISGAGRGASIISSASATNDTLDIGTTAPSNYSHILVEHVGFFPSVTKTAGAEVAILGNNVNVEVSDFEIGGGYNGVFIDSYGTGIMYRIHDFYIVNAANNGIIVGTSNGQPADIYLYQGNITAAATGMLFQNASGLYVNNIDVVLSTGNGILFSPTSGMQVVFGFFDTVLSDTNTGIGWLFQQGGTGIVTNIVLSKIWSAANSGTAGIYITQSASNVVNGITIQNSIVRDNQQHGIVLSAGTNVVLDANQICNNSIASSGGYDGIVVSPGFTGFTITNNISGACGFEQAGGGANKQAYGLVLNSSAATNNFIITGNRFPSNVTGGMDNAATGANQVVTGNLSF